MLCITTETAADSQDVEYLYDLAFGPGRQALSSYRLRDGVPAVAPLCLLARESAALAGAIRYWPVKVGEARALLLGPVAVHPTRQGEGVGGQLIAESLFRAESLGWARVLLVGDAPYYARFGFTPVVGITFPPPTNPARVLGRALQAGAFDGVGGTVKPDRG
ncbi:MAG: N-acetyltransferase [Rhodobacteraceae bacterium]|nr:N-acetyltransferase [Paracoccaceae bacterium]